MKTIKTIKSIKTTVSRKTIKITKPLHHSKPRQAAESQNKQGNKCVKPSHSKLSEIIEIIISTRKSSEITILKTIMKSMTTSKTEIIQAK